MRQGPFCSRARFIGHFMNSVSTIAKRFFAPDLNFPLTSAIDIGTDNNIISSSISLTPSYAMMASVDE